MQGFVLLRINEVHHILISSHFLLSKNEVLWLTSMRCHVDR